MKGFSFRARRGLARLDRGVVLNQTRLKYLDSKGKTKTLEDLTNYTADDLMCIKDFGVTSVNEVREKLSEFNLYLKGENYSAR